MSTVTNPPSSEDIKETNSDLIVTASGNQEESVSEKENDNKETATPKEEFRPPIRPSYGKDGRSIALRVNYYRLHIPSIIIYHYHVDIVPSSSRKTNREVIGGLINTFTLYFTRASPVYDGRNYLYTLKSIPIGQEKMDFQVKLPHYPRQFTVSLKWMANISTEGFERDVAENNPFICPKSSHAVDVILRHLSAMKYFPFGKSFFSPPGPLSLGCPANGNNELGNSREVWFGFHQSIQPTEWKMMLNIDLSTTAFYRSCPVLDFLAAVLELPTQALAHRGVISDAQRIRFTREIKHLKVEVTHMGKIRRKYRVRNVTRKSALTQTFLLNGKDDVLIECTVAKYFLDKYNLELSFGHLPCLEVGQENRSTFLPIEVCQIALGQRCHKKLTEYQTSAMIKASGKTAPQREMEINGLLEKAQICRDPFVNDYGISISPQMTEVSGRVLSAPKLLYGANSANQHYQTVIPHLGTWDMRGKQLHSGAEINTWAMVSFAGQDVVKESDLRRFTAEIRRLSTSCGMPIKKQPIFCKYASGVEQVEPMFKFIKSTHPTIQLIIVVLPGKTCIYAEIKKIGDVVVGIPTQCIAARNITRASPQSICNICLKINLKMGGVNTIIVPISRPKIFEEPVIFLGADVSHPTHTDVFSRKPSIAAVVGSMDAHPSRYAASVRLQGTRQEIISEMCYMVRDLLIKFRQSTGFRPMRIVMYRNGLSEGQYYNALQHELRAIREACQMLEAGYHPAVTYIIVQKRHHTRLFAADPQDFTGNAQNVPAGTVVDSGIMHPSQFDFFLCSHAGIQGTSRPSRYHVMWDDSKISADDLQKLTYQICHTYARCTRSVSIPAPAYYAYLVASRAKYHIIENTGKTESSFVDSLYSVTSTDYKASLEAMKNAVKVHPDISKIMYFA